MKVRGHVVRGAVNAVALLAVGIAPFLVYAGIQAGARTDAPEWPAPIVVTTGSPDELTSLSLLSLSPEPVLVRIPTTTLVDVPAGGRLRAETAYRIGKTPSVARALSATTGVDAPYWAHWPGTIEDGFARTESATNLGGNVADVRAALGSLGLNTGVYPAPGVVRESQYFDAFVLDVPAFRKLVATGVGVIVPTASPSPSPTATSSIDPARISIVVMNQGAPSGSATRTADALRARGFALARVGDAPSGAVDGNFVYYTTSRAHAEAVRAALNLTATIAEPPRGYSKTSDVIVVLGRTEATPSSTPARSPRRSSPSPRSSESVTTIG